MDTSTYQLFLKIAKSLAMKLPRQKHRILAAKWVRKIDSLVDISVYTKSYCLKLLIIAMQSQILVGPFMQEPPEDDFNVTSMVRLKPVDIKNMIVECKEFDFHRPNPYYAEISADLKEYLVYQEIPEFGSHFYYACSTDPITMWAKRKYAIIPKGALEPVIMIPPLHHISETKEDYVNTYQTYLDNLNRKKCKPQKHCTEEYGPIGKCKPKKKSGVADCSNDSASDYVEYKLIGQGVPKCCKSGSRRPQNNELPERISFYVGDDPEPFQYQLAV